MYLNLHNIFISQNNGHSSTFAGFGDLFPGASVGGGAEAQEKLIITSVYLLLGMALIAMCFNLAQEEVVNKVQWLTQKFSMRKKQQEETTSVQPVE